MDAEKLTFSLQVRCQRQHSEMCNNCLFDLYKVCALWLISWVHLYCRSTDCSSQLQCQARFRTKLCIRKVCGQAQARHRSKDQGGGLKQLPKSFKALLEQVLPSVWCELRWVPHQRAVLEYRQLNSRQARALAVSKNNVGMPDVTGEKNET